MHRPPHLVVRVAVPILECHDALTALDRQRGVEEGIEEREEARADGDADRQARTADDRQARILHEHPGAKLQINA